MLKYKIGDKVQLTFKEDYYDEILWNKDFIHFLKKNNFTFTVIGLRAYGLYVEDNTSSYLITFNHFNVKVLGKKKLILNLTR